MLPTGISSMWATSIAVNLGSTANACNRTSPSALANKGKNNRKMNKVRITAIRQTVYTDLMAKYENPIEHTCDVKEGQQWVSINGQCPEGMCPSAWYSMREFVDSLTRGEGNFYDGWMKNPMSAMISCNDGFRPFSFYIEVVE